MIEHRFIQGNINLVISYDSNSIPTSYTSFFNMKLSTTVGTVLLLYWDVNLIKYQFRAS